MGIKSSLVFIYFLKQVGREVIWQISIRKASELEAGLADFSYKHSTTYQAGKYIPNEQKSTK
jgi:hypothetical protein